MFIQRKYPLLVRFALFVAVPLAIVAGLGVRQLRQSLPQSEGRIVVAGIAHDVRIERDGNGLVRIAAATDRDAYFAIGYAHAQDRLWQLELQRRIAHGRLSEVFGKASVEQDVWFRTLGLDRAAHTAWDSLSPDARTSIEAYTAGVNRFLDGNPVLPVEFTLLGIRPEPWTVYDSLAWMKVLALNLGGNFRREIDRLLMSHVIEPERLQVLFPEYASGVAPASIALDDAQRAKLEQVAGLQASIESQLAIGGRYVGSNAWAVGGKLTGGGALLANDPHLGLQIPSLWYMASIKGDALDVSGATLVGVPVVIFGRNADIAWGGTNLMADAQDLYLEQVDPNDGSRYSVDGTWTKFEEREESIAVRQDFPAFLRNPIEPLRIRVRASRHGPLISDMYQLFDQPAALRWTALDRDDTSYEAFYRVGYARDWASFQAALRPLVAPAMNLLYADRAGNVGYLAAGRMPVRKAGDGTVPVAGWNDDHEWTGAIPFEQWPRSYNPPAGYVVSANNKPVGDDYPYLITRDWAPPARAQRIGALLERAAASGAPVDADAMRRIQADTRSEPAHRLLGLLLKHEPTSDPQRRAVTYLKDWDGDMNGRSQAATIFNAWTRALKQRVLIEQVKGYWNRSRESRYLRSVAAGVDLEVLYGVLSDARNRWCDDRDTADVVESCDDVIDASLNAALTEVRKLKGTSMEGWAWGDVHETVYRHLPFSQVNALRSVFERRVGNGGSPDSVNVATYTLEKGSYTQDFGAGVRQVVALAPGRTGHWYMNSTGQSGNVMSPHYDDMIERFRNVEYLSMTGGEGGDVLTLAPAAEAAP